MESDNNEQRFIEPSRFEGTVLLISALISLVLAHALMFTSGIIVAELIDYFQTGSGFTSWVGTIIPATAMVIAPLSGLSVRRFGVRKVTTVSGTLFGIFIALSAFSPNTYTILTIWLLAGVCSSFSILPVFTYSVTRFRKYRAVAHGFVTTGPCIATFLYPVIINFTLIEYGWRGCVLIIGGITLNLLPAALMLRNRNDTRMKKKDILLQEMERNSNTQDNVQQNVLHKTNLAHLAHLHLFRKRIFNITLCQTFLYYMAVSVIYVHIVAGSRDLLGVTTEQARFTITALGASNLLGRLLFSFLAQIPRVDVFTLYLITCLIVGATAGVFPLFEGFAAAMSLSAILGLGLGGYGCLLLLVVADLLGDDDIHMAFSYTQLTGGIGFGLGAPLAGWLYDSLDDYSFSLYFGAVVAGASVLILIPDWWIHIHR